MNVFTSTLNFISPEIGQIFRNRNLILTVPCCCFFAFSACVTCISQKDTLTYELNIITLFNFEESYIVIN